MEQKKLSAKQLKGLKIATDCLMMLFLVLVMSYQATGDVLHEWFGIAAFVLFIAHHVLNRPWYKTILRRKQSTYRLILNIIDLLLLVSFASTALCGMAMSGHAVPFLYGMMKISFARRMHLSMSRWTYLLTGVHLGMHIPGMLPKKWRTGKRYTVLLLVSSCICGIGIWIASRNGVWSDLLFRSPFAFYEYGKLPVQIILEQVLIFVPGVFIGEQLSDILRVVKKGEKESGFLRLFSIVLAIAVWILCMMLDPFM